MLFKVSKARLKAPKLGVQSKFTWFLHYAKKKKKSQLIKIHNTLDSSGPYLRLLENQKTWISRDLFLPENCTVNGKKWLKNENLWFLEFYFYLKYISNKDDIWQREYLKINKSIMAVQKCKIMLLQAALKDFWSSANLKTKKIKFVKTPTSLELYILKKMQKLGFLRVTLVWKSFKILLHNEFSQKSLREHQQLGFVMLNDNLAVNLKPAHPPLLNRKGQFTFLKTKSSHPSGIVA